jgi:WD40 repeat protein
MLLTASSDNIARLWEAERDELLATLEGHQGAVRSAV